MKLILFGLAAVMAGCAGPSRKEMVRQKAQEHEMRDKQKHDAFWNPLLTDIKRMEKEAAARDAARKAGGSPYGTGSKALADYMDYEQQRNIENRVSDLQDGQRNLGMKIDAMDRWDNFQRWREGR